MTLSLARDLSPEGIRVNTILPGSFDTPMVAGVPAPTRDAMVRSILYPKRFGHADEYAAAVLALLRNGYLNATLLRLDGGARLA